MTTESSSPTESIPAPHNAPAPALFTLDLGANGGVLAPTTGQELHDWIMREHMFWQWNDNHPGNSNFRSAIEFGREQLKRAASTIQSHLSQETSAPDNFVNQVHLIGNMLNDVYRVREFPHSSTPLAQRVDQLRQRDMNEAQAYLFANIPWNGATFDGRDSPSWRGFVEGLSEKFGMLPASEEQHQAAMRSVDFLMARAGQMLGEKSGAYGELHRHYNELAQKIADAEVKHQADFAALMETSEKQHEEAVTAHQAAMGALQKTYSEAMALRAPVDYWNDRKLRHDKRSRITGLFAFGSMAVLAASVGVIAYWVLSNLTPDGKPEAWRVAVIGLVGVLGVWAVRLIVRLFLSNAHLATDADERVTMVKTYLALMEADKLPSDDDKKLILQALFRPASDGMVKDEGLPHPALEFLTKMGGR
jgi:hypothetical protein